MDKISYKVRYIRINEINTTVELLSPVCCIIEESEYKYYLRLANTNIRLLDDIINKENEKLINKAISNVWIINNHRRNIVDNIEEESNIVPFTRNGLTLYREANMKNYAFYHSSYIFTYQRLYDLSNSIMYVTLNGKLVANNLELSQFISLYFKNIDDLIALVFDLRLDNLELNSYEFKIFTTILGIVNSGIIHNILSVHSRTRKPNKLAEDLIKKLYETK